MSWSKDRDKIESRVSNVTRGTIRVDPGSLEVARWSQRALTLAAITYNETRNWKLERANVESLTSQLLYGDGG